jgi:hypothetical protein
VIDSHRTTDFGRRALSYSLEGLAARDEMLFKSLVRLLDHLTVQKWIYRPASPDYRVDLLVVAEWYPPTVFQHSHRVGQPVLSVGKGVDRDLYLSWPVQPLRLQAELNRIGGVAILHQIHDAQAPLGPVHGNSDGDSNQLFRLKQWPPSRFLAGVGRMRLATLLTGRGMTLQELQQRSSLQMSVCRAFVSDLDKARLLVVTAAEAPVVDTKAALLEPHQVLNLPSSAVAFAKPGLLARIRAGLGIKSSHGA